MNLRKKDGFTGIDISIAVIVILIFIPTIFGIIYNSSKTRQVANRKAISISKVVEILEEAKEQGVENAENYFAEKYTKNDQTGIYEGTFSDKYDIAYKIEISFEYPSQYMPEDESTNVVKRIIAKVIYPTGNTTKTIEISTVLKKVT